MPYSSHWDRLDTASRYAVKRFALKLGMLLGFSALQAGSTYGAVRALYLMLTVIGIVDVAIAMFQRVSPFGSTLTYWDEAAVFFMLAIAVHWIL